MHFSQNTIYRSAIFSLVILSGCATTSKNDTLAEEDKFYQFEPIPIAEIGTQDLNTNPPANAAHLLEQAQAAFESANEALAAGDTVKANAQYSAMMEYLLESNLDPSTFYDLRKEFNKILAETTKIARRQESNPKRQPKTEIGKLATRSELEYPDPLNDRVLIEIRQIQQAYPKNFQAGLNRSAKYLPYIREEFRKAGLPQDLVWLAMVESQFTPRIDSRVGAGGMWQFMPTTGRRFGLERDHYLDERYDWKKSTQASIKYLSDLYEGFGGNWPLAVSAYNMGEGGVERAVAMNNGQRDLWQLLDTAPASNRIPLETKKFYAKLLASAIVANNPEEYGFTYDPAPVEETKAIQATGAYTISDLEKASGLEVGTLQKLNTQFLYGYTPPNRTTNLYVPVEHSAKIQSALSNMPKLRPDTHLVRRGETLSGIATLYQVSQSDLMTANRISSPRRLQINQRLVIPGRLGATTGLASTSEPGERKVHTVGKGDSLSRIASRNGVTVNQLQVWNALGRQTRIHVGDRLYVSKPEVVNTAPAKAESDIRLASAPAGNQTVYTVKSGDYLDKIARSQGVELKDLLAWNSLTTRSTIRAGDEIKLYSAEAPVHQPTPPATDGTSGTHTVKRGENPGVIAKQYKADLNDVLAWNGLTMTSIVHVGDVLYVRNPQEITLSKNTEPAATEIVHVVARGESPSAIARKYKVSLNELYSWNGWSKDPIIRVGQKLRIIQ